MSSSPKAKSSSKKSKTTSRKARKFSPEELLKALKAASVLFEEGGQQGALAALAECGINGPLILVGQQHVRTRRTIDWIKEKFFSQTSAASSSYFGLELAGRSALSNITEALSNLSLFAQTQFIVIYEADKVKAAPARTLAEVIKKSTDTALVVLTGESVTQKAVLLSELSSVGTVVEFKDLNPTMLRRWIEKEVQRCGGASGIEPDAAALLVKCYGSDVTALSREISKLTLLTRSDERINRALVEQISLKAPEVTSFALITQLARRNAPAAVSLAQELMAQGFHPLQVCNFLSRCIRTLLATSGGTTPSEAAPELNNAWFLRNLEKASRLFSPAELIEALEILKNLDFQLKDSRLPHPLVLTLAVQRIALRQSRRAA